MFRSALHLSGWLVVRPPPPIAVRKFPLIVWMAYTPFPRETRLNFSQLSSCVAFECMTSVMRPPPPTAVR